jgi:septum formation protein
LRAVFLASASPRRRQLLESVGLKFTVDPADIVETIPDSDDPAALARGLSLMKARVVATRHRDSVIIAADTLGFLDGSILGKPASEDDAASMLGLLSGRCHRVITGLSVIDTGTEREITRSVETLVCFRKLELKEIWAYVRSGEPMGKAGSYAIQGLGSLLVERIDGDYFNVVGLPLNALALALREVGIDLFNFSSG